MLISGGLRIRAAGAGAPGNDLELVVQAGSPFSIETPTPTRIVIQIPNGSSFQDLLDGLDTVTLSNYNLADNPTFMPHGQADADSIVEMGTYQFSGGADANPALPLEGGFEIEFEHGHPVGGDPGNPNRGIPAYVIVHGGHHENTFNYAATRHEGELTLIIRLTQSTPSFGNLRHWLATVGSDSHPDFDRSRIVRPRADKPMELGTDPNIEDARPIDHFPTDVFWPVLAQVDTYDEQYLRNIPVYSWVEVSPGVTGVAGTTYTAGTGIDLDSGTNAFSVDATEFPEHNDPDRRDQVVTIDVTGGVTSKTPVENIVNPNLLREITGVHADDAFTVWSQSHGEARKITRENLGLPTGGSAADGVVTGGTFDNTTGTLTLNRSNNLDPITVTDFPTGTGGTADGVVTSGTFDPATGVLTLNRSVGNPVTVSGLPTSGGTSQTYVFRHGLTESGGTVDLSVDGLNSINESDLRDSPGDYDLFAYDDDANIAKRARLGTIRSSLDNLQTDHDITGGDVTGTTLTLTTRGTDVDNVEITGLPTGGSATADGVVTNVGIEGQTVTLTRSVGEPLTFDIPVDPNYYVTGGTWNNDGTITLNRQGTSTAQITGIPAIPSAYTPPDTATQDQAEDHTDTNVYSWTPQRVAQAATDAVTVPVIPATVTQDQAEDDTDTNPYMWTPQRVHQAAEEAVTVPTLPATATKAQAEDATSDTVYGWTPKRVAQAAVDAVPRASFVFSGTDDPSTTPPTAPSGGFTADDLYVRYNSSGRLLSVWRYNVTDSAFAEIADVDGLNTDNLVVYGATDPTTSAPTGLTRSARADDLYLRDNSSNKLVGIYRYTGTEWEKFADVDAIPVGMSAAEAEAGTVTNTRLISPLVLKNAIIHHRGALAVSSDFTTVPFSTDPKAFTVALLKEAFPNGDSSTIANPPNPDSKKALWTATDLRTAVQTYATTGNLPRRAIAASRNVTGDDNNSLLVYDSSDDFTLTFPASNPLPDGGGFMIYAKGSGTLTLAAASGVTLSQEASEVSLDVAPGGVVAVQQVGSSDEYLLRGDFHETAADGRTRNAPTQASLNRHVFIFWANVAETADAPTFTATWDGDSWTGLLAPWVQTRTNPADGETQYMCFIAVNRDANNVWTQETPNIIVAEGALQFSATGSDSDAHATEQAGDEYVRYRTGLGNWTPWIKYRGEPTEWHQIANVNTQTSSGLTVTFSETLDLGSISDMKFRYEWTAVTVSGVSGSHSRYAEARTSSDMIFPNDPNTTAFVYGRTARFTFNNDEGSYIGIGVADTSGQGAWNRYQRFQGNYWRPSQSAEDANRINRIRLSRWGQNDEGSRLVVWYR